MHEEKFDTIIKNIQVVRPFQSSVVSMDVGIRDGKITEVAPNLQPDRTAETVEGGGLLAFPGVVDAHTHVGIYGPLEEDAVSESRAAAQGGVTTMLTYFRTGQYYLNKGGPYAEFFPEMLRLSEGRYHGTTPITWRPSTVSTSKKWSS